MSTKPAFGAARRRSGISRGAIATSAIKARTALNSAMSEEQLLQAVTEALTLYGWRWTHTRRSDKALQQGHPGFPDICAARNGEVLFIECKRKGAFLTPGQNAWLVALGPALKGGYALVAFPDRLDEIIAMVASPRNPGEEAAP